MICEGGLEASNNESVEDRPIQEITHRQWALDNFDIDTSDLENNKKKIRNEIQEALKSFDFASRPQDFSEQFFDFMEEVGGHVTYKELSFPSTFSEKLENGLRSDVFKRVKVLEIDSGSMRSLPELKYLQKLILSNCSDLLMLDGNFSSLMNLKVFNSNEIREITGEFPALKYLEIDQCSSLRDIHFFNSSTPVIQISLEGCNNLSTLTSGYSASGSGDLNYIVSGNFPKLRHLFIKGSPQIEQIGTPLADSTIDFSKLNILQIENCPDLKAVGLTNANSLSVLKITVPQTLTDKEKSVLKANIIDNLDNNLLDIITRNENNFEKDIDLSGYSTLHDNEDDVRMGSVIKARDINKLRAKL